MQVLNTLFFVETRRIENPRNILQLLSMNTRRTKVVELSSGTHRYGPAHLPWSDAVVACGFVRTSDTPRQVSASRHPPLRR